MAKKTPKPKPKSKLLKAATQGLSTTKDVQRKASAALKADRLAMKGLTTRRVGHAQAQTGRSQARRDGRNASR